MTLFLVSGQVKFSVQLLNMPLMQNQSHNLTIFEMMHLLLFLIETEDGRMFQRKILFIPTGKKVMSQYLIQSLNVTKHFICY